MIEVIKQVPKTVDEMISYFRDNVEVVRDLIYINIPTKDEEAALATTKSGIYLGAKPGDAAKDEYLYTILGCGPDVTDLKPGDKIVCKIKLLEMQMIEGNPIAVISRFQVIGKMKNA